MSLNELLLHLALQVINLFHQIVLEDFGLVYLLIVFLLPQLFLSPKFVLLLSNSSIALFGKLTEIH